MNKTLKLALIIGGVIISVILLAVVSLNGVGNKAIGYEEQVKSASSDVEIQEKRRVDLLYNLVDTVKAYDKHESETLKSVIQARSSKDVNISDVNTMISATAEAYPQLKSNENYKQLMNELSITENMIAQCRNTYNLQIKEYNRYTKKFPNKQVLSIVGYEVINYEYLEYNAPSDSPKNLFGDK